ncbi:MAG: P-loop NTPase [Myxococcales bacterium]|nr:P-loop NTPase [Myxococcales bacterium]
MRDDGTPPPPPPDPATDPPTARDPALDLAHDPDITAALDALAPDEGPRRHATRTTNATEHATERHDGAASAPPRPTALRIEAPTDTLDCEAAHPDDDGHEDRELDSLVGEFPWDDDPPPGPLRIAIAGGAGGVGRTLLAANIALHLARDGHRVAAIDLDPNGAGLHTALGLPPLLPPPAAHLHPAPRPAEPIPGAPLTLLRAARPTYTGPADPHRAALHAAATDRAEAIHVYDLGAATDPLTLDTWLTAHVALIIAEPLPAAIERAYAWLRAALWRRLLHGDDPPAQAARATLTALPDLDGPLALIRALTPHHPAAAQAIRARLLAFTPRLILNRTRSRADREMGTGITSALRRRWGITAEYLGALDFDDAVLDAARRHRPLLLAYPGAAYSLALDPIARRVAALTRSRP